MKVNVKIFYYKENYKMKAEGIDEGRNIRVVFNKKDSKVLDKIGFPNEVVFK